MRVFSRLFLPRNPKLIPGCFAQGGIFIQATLLGLHRTRNEGSRQAFFWGCTTLRCYLIQIPNQVRDDGKIWGDDKAWGDGKVRDDDKAWGDGKARVTAKLG